MGIDKWNQRYLAGEQVFDAPAPLVEKFAANLAPGVALDLACGPGRNALYLAERGWRVTAVDGSSVAIDLLRRRARERNLHIDSLVADLEQDEFEIQPEAYDLICDSYYLQRNLISPIQRGLRRDGMAIVIVHLAGPDQPRGTHTRAVPGELRNFFAGWTILHDYEGQPGESCHQHAVAEIVAKKPPAGSPMKQ